VIVLTISFLKEEMSILQENCGTQWWWVLAPTFNKEHGWYWYLVLAWYGNVR